MLEVKGIYPAAITPMKEDESPNLAAIPPLVERLLAAGVHGLFVLGTQGESYALTEEERDRVLREFLAVVAGRVPVIAGAGAVTTRQALRYARLAEEAGADAISLIAPYFIAPGQDELYAHFRAIAESTRLPVLLYNHPFRTHLRIEPATVARLAEVDNIVGVKDSAGDIVNTMAYVNQTPEGFAVMNGHDGLVCSALQVGAAGAVTATGNIVPELFVRIYQAARAGDWAAALETQRRVLPLRAMFAAGTAPDPIKEAARMIGLPVGPTARPAGPMSPGARQALRRVLLDLGLEVVA